MMVIRKDKVKEPELIEDAGLGTVKTFHKDLKKDVYAVLDDFDVSVPYSDIKYALQKKFPKKYNDLSNGNVKMACVQLASEDKIVD